MYFRMLICLRLLTGGKTGDSQAHLRETAAKLEQTLNVFGVNAKVNNISCGPAVTRFESHTGAWSEGIKDCESGR